MVTKYFGLLFLFSRVAKAGGNDFINICVLFVVSINKNHNLSNVYSDRLILINSLNKNLRGFNCLRRYFCLNILFRSFFFRDNILMKFILKKVNH